MQTAECTMSERPTRPVPPPPPSDRVWALPLPLELEVTLFDQRTRDGFFLLSEPQQTAYAEWVADGETTSVRAMRALMVSRVVRQLV